MFIFIPVPKSENCEKLEVEHMFNDGKADIDVCWNSRGDPCKKKCKSYRRQRCNATLLVGKEKMSSLAKNCSLQDISYPA